MSLADNEVTKKKNDDMNTYLKFSKKKRIPIKGDGHCLPRAVFRGAKQLNILSDLEYIKYSQLLNVVIDDIKNNISAYESINTNGSEAAKNALDIYAKEKIYSSEENIIDAVIMALAMRTMCTITVHYQRADDAFYQHEYPPSNEVPKGEDTHFFYSSCS